MFALKPVAIDAHLNWIRDQESIIDCGTKKWRLQSAIQWIM